MPTIQREKVVPYSPQQMFDLINTVEDYPKFVPYCKSATIVNQTTDELHVQLDFAKGALHKSFTTCNRLQKDKMIEVRLLDGPFKQVEGFWRFDAITEGCHITLDMEFEFSNGLIATLFGPVFNTITNTLVEVFCERAAQVFKVS